MSLPRLNETTVGMSVVSDDIATAIATTSSEQQWQQQRQQQRQWQSQEQPLVMQSQNTTYTSAINSDNGYSYSDAQSDYNDKFEKPPVLLQQQDDELQRQQQF